MLEKKLLPRDWIYKNIFNFNQDDIDGIDSSIIKDQKEAYRLTKISEDGEDPANPVPKKEPEGEEEEEGNEKEKGNEKGKEENPFEENINLDLQKEYDKNSKKKERKTPEVPKGGWPGAGRPKEGMKYNSHEHPRGYDPLGRIAWKNARNESVDTIKKYGLSKLLPTKTKKQGLITEQSSFLDESNIIPE
jgi:hypothetical protein